MPRKFSTFSFAFFWIFIDASKVQGSSLKCCFSDLENNSVSYQLSHLPGPSCNPTWSCNGLVAVDENGDVDTKTVAHHEPQKLIMKNMCRNVSFRLDCTSSGISYQGMCNESCATPDVPIKATPDPPQTILIIISICIIIFFIFIIPIVILGIKHHTRSNCKFGEFWSVVPNEETSPQNEV